MKRTIVLMVVVLVVAVLVVSLAGCPQPVEEEEIAPPTIESMPPERGPAGMEMEEEVEVEEEVEEEAELEAEEEAPE